MIKKTLLLMALSVSAWGAGPMFQQKDTIIQQEFDNVYNDLRNPRIDNGFANFMQISSATISSATIQNLIVSNITGVSLGKIRQVVFSSETTGGSTTSGTFVAMGASQSITPTSASSKILIIGVGFLTDDTSSDGHQAVLGLGRGGTAIWSRSGSPFRYHTGGTSATYGVSIPLFYLDSPATTASTTYQLMVASGAGSNILLGGAAATGVATYILLAEVGP